MGDTEIKGKQDLEIILETLWLILPGSLITASEIAAAGESFGFFSFWPST